MSELVMEGRILADRYEVTRLLGKGGMGAVYEARNHLGKRYAVKLLLGVVNDEQLIQRFFREAKASAAIESEHIVEVYDTGVDPQTGLPFIIMEMLRGEDLEHTITRVGALNPLASARVMSQAAEGLAAAHAAGIVHRDIKPANIFMAMRGPGDLVVKILDFGIAKQSMDQLGASSGGLTRTGSMLGTPLYMSPEQARGLRTVDLRSDVWSLGMCFYEALSGQTPWKSIESLGELILAICTREITPLRDIAPWVSPELSGIVHRMLQRDPQFRTANCRALIDELTPFLGGSVLLTPEILTGAADANGTAVVPPTLEAGGSSLQTVTGVLRQTPQQLYSTGGATHTALERRSSGWMYAGIGLAAVVVLGAAGFAVLGASSKKPFDEPHPANTVDNDPTPPPDPKPVVKHEPATPTPDPDPPLPAASSEVTPPPPTPSTKPPKTPWKPPGKVVVGPGPSVVVPPPPPPASKKKDNGDSCNVGSECASNNCQSGTCRRKITEQLPL